MVAKTKKKSREVIKNSINVASEIGTLKRVLVHRPDMGIDRISPKSAEELLFDDIVYLPKMQEEHDIFVEVLEAFLGKGNVLDTQKLLLEAFKNKAKKALLIKLVCEFEELPDIYRDLLWNISDEELNEVLITGYCESEETRLFDPIPNFIFARDIAVVINDHVLITKAAKSARHRENLLTQFIFHAHPIFKELQDNNRIINLNRVNEFPPSRKGEQVSVEGGDVMIVNKDYLLVGCSERTTQHGFNLLKERLFRDNVIKNIVRVNISSARSWMHIDTVFTQISEDFFAAYKPMVIDGLASNVEVYRQGEEGVSASYPTVKTFLQAEINPKMDFVLSGGGVSPYQEREQWTDGCNLVVVKSGVGLTYDRNEKTAEHFKAKGFDIIGAIEFLQGVKEGKIDPNKIEKTIVTLPSGELSRARGGSHCLTCPIERV